MKDCNEQVNKFESDTVKMSEAGRKDIYGHAKSNRNRIKKSLADKSKPTATGFSTQGSYSMRTMIQYVDGDYDIDDGVYFKIDKLVDANGKPMKALDARKMICDAAQDDRFNDKPEVRKNCVRVYYNEGYHVDVPVYRTTETTNPLTNQTTKTFELASADWKASDPLSVTNWFKKQNSSKSTDATKNANDGQLIRVVRLLKNFARSRASWEGSIASGFAITKLACDHFVEDKSRDDRALRDTAKKMVASLKLSEQIIHPTLLNENITDAGDTRVKFLREKLEENLGHLNSLDNEGCTHKAAMLAWDNFFSTDWFSKEPDPSEEDELEKKVTGPAIIKRGDSRYARNA